MPLDAAQHERNEKGVFQPGPLEADLVSIIQQVPAAIAIVKGSTFIIEVANPQTLEVWGKTWEEVAGRPVFEVFPELLGQGFDKILSRVFQTGVRFVASEARVDLVRHGRPETLYVNFSYDPYRDREGKVIGIISTGTDVTELVKAKQALTESNERLRLAMETVEMGTWDYNPATGTILCSELTQELFGFFAGDPITLDRVLEAVVETDRPRVMAAIQKALTPESGGHYNVEYSLINYYDQKLRTIRAKGQVFFQQGVAHRFIGTALDITPEIKAREEQQKLRSLVDNSLELMSVLELDGRNSYLNKAGMELLGFDSFEQVLNTPIAQLHTPEDIAFVEAQVLPGVLTRGKWSGVMNVRHLKTGEVFPVHNNTVRIDDPRTGEPIAIGAVMRDLRPEQEARQSLAHSEARLRNVIEQAPSPILILKGEDMVLEVANKALFELWNVGAEALGKKFLEILPEMEGQGFMELLLDVYRNHKPHYGYEVPALFHRAGGEQELVYFNFVYQPYREESGQVSGVLVIATDVTGQVNAQRRLLKSEATLSLAVQSAHFGVYELDMVHQKITHSPKAAEIFGLNPTRQWPFSAFTGAVHPDDVPIRVQAHEQALKTGSLFYEVRIFWPDGSLHWIRLNGRITQRNGVAVSSVGTVMDITEEKKRAEILEERIRQRTGELQLANEQLAHSNQQLEQFAHVASHDMKEPIRKISLFMDRLVSELAPAFNSRAESYVEKIQKSVYRLTQMVEGVLTYASVRATEEKREPVNLNEIIRSIEHDLELIIQQKGADIHCGDLPRIRAVPFLMYQLFYNLINNSLKFAKADTPALIKLEAAPFRGVQWEGITIEPERGYWEFVVTDNGIGFSPEHAENIFMTFTRLHARDQYEGTGLGLALCRSIVERHQGFIKAQGKVGEGAVFKILLPDNEGL